MMFFTDARIAWHDSMHESAQSITATSMSQAESATRKVAERHRMVELVFAAQGEDMEARVNIARAKVERQRMTAQQTRTDKFDSTARCARVAGLAKVQRAIASLSLPLQRFGCLMYSPTATGVDLECSRHLLASRARLPPMPDEKRIKASCLVLPALLSYRGTAFGGREDWTPGRVAEFVADYGERIAVANWARDWAATWEALLSTAADFDRQALDPVWAVINSERREAANDPA